MYQTNLPSAVLLPFDWWLVLIKILQCVFMCLSGCIFGNWMWELRVCESFHLCLIYTLVVGGLLWLCIMSVECVCVCLYVCLSVSPSYLSSGKLTCHISYSWACWKGWDSSRWCLLKTHQTTATCPSHSAHITHPGGMCTHTRTHTRTQSIFFLFCVDSMVEVVNSLVNSASRFSSEFKSLHLHWVNT